MAVITRLTGGNPRPDRDNLMTAITAFDFETTGKYIFKKPPSDPAQPWPVSLSAVSYSSDGQYEVGCMSCIIRPDNWVISEESTKIHGISHEFAMQHGLPLDLVLDLFEGFVERSIVMVAFNSDFDRHIYEAACVRRKREINMDKARVRCAMKATKNLLRIPTKWGDWKWPKLDEAYAWVFGAPRASGAHNSLVDTRDTLYLSLALRDDLHVWDFETQVEPTKEAVASLLHDNETRKAAA